MKWVMACVIACSVLGGCEAPPSGEPAPASSASADLSDLFATRRAEQQRTDPNAVLAHLNSPRAAAQEVVTRSRPLSPADQKQINLHAALYLAAIRSDQHGHRAYLLHPVENEQVSQAHGVTGREFRLRVLAQFTGMPKPVSWDARDLTWMFDERAPGGPAALVWFEVIRTNEELATVEADVCLESPAIGTRKQRVEAVFDGKDWNVRDLGARTVW